MARVKGGVTAKARHKKVLGKAKGYYGARSKLFKTAKQAVIKAGQYAYRDRRQRKRQFRALWITRINAAARLNGMSYSRLINGMNLAQMEIDRKVLADLGSPRRALVVVAEPKEMVWKSFRNFPGVKIRTAANLCSHDVVAGGLVIAESAAMDALAARVGQLSTQGGEA